MSSKVVVSLLQQPLKEFCNLQEWQLHIEKIILDAINQHSTNNNDTQFNDHVEHIPGHIVCFAEYGALELFSVLNVVFNNNNKENNNNNTHTTHIITSEWLSATPSPPTTQPINPEGPTFYTNHYDNVQRKLYYQTYLLQFLLPIFHYTFEYISKKYNIVIIAPSMPLLLINDNLNNVNDDNNNQCYIQLLKEITTIIGSQPQQQLLKRSEQEGDNDNSNNSNISFPLSNTQQDDIMKTLDTVYTTSVQNHTDIVSSSSCDKSKDDNNTNIILQNNNHDGNYNNNRYIIPSQTIKRITPDYFVNRAFVYSPNCCNVIQDLLSTINNTTSADYNNNTNYNNNNRSKDFITKLTTTLIPHQDKLIMTRFEHELWCIRTPPVPSLTRFVYGNVCFGIQICYDSEFSFGTHLLCHNIEGNSNVITINNNNQGENDLLLKQTTQEEKEKENVICNLIFVPSCTETRRGANRVHYGSRARAMEGHVYTAVAQTVGECSYSDVTDINYGFAAVYATCDVLFPEDGVIISNDIGYNNKVNIPNCLTTILDLNLISRIKTEASVINWKDADKRFNKQYNTNKNNNNINGNVGDNVMTLNGNVINVNIVKL